MNPIDPNYKADFPEDVAAGVAAVMKAANGPREPDVGILDSVSGVLSSHESDQLLTDLPAWLRSDLAEWRDRCCFRHLLDFPEIEGREAAEALTGARAFAEASGRWDLNHSRRIQVPETPLTAAISEMRGGGSCWLTVVSDDPRLRGAEIQFDLGGGVRGRLSLRAVDGKCTGSAECAIAWTDIDVEKARFKIVRRSQSG